jgi:hypothetical protein
MLVSNFGNPYDIWAFGYRLPMEAAVFLGTMFALLCVAAICQFHKL